MSLPDTDSLPLIQTKFYKPRTSEGLIARPRLLEQLDRGREQPITLVVAPAGYGKTSLVAAWLEVCDWPSTWLSLDEEDSGAAESGGRNAHAAARQDPGQ